MVIKMNEKQSRGLQKKSKVWSSPTSSICFNKSSYVSSAKERKRTTFLLGMTIFTRSKHRISRRTTASRHKPNGPQWFQWNNYSSPQLSQVSLWIEFEYCLRYRMVFKSAVRRIICWLCPLNYSRIWFVHMTPSVKVYKAHKQKCYKARLWATRD